MVSFNRSTVRINGDSVGLILQSCLGGVAEDFQVSWLKDWCFQFKVSSKSVGFMVYRILSIRCNLFYLHFSLWRDGGPDYVKERAICEAKQDDEWHLVTKSKKSYAAIAKMGSSVFKRLQFPPNYYAQNFASEFTGDTCRDSLDSQNSHVLEHRANLSQLGKLFLQNSSNQARCFRCLASGHKVQFGKNDVRCKSFFLSRLIARNCRARSMQNRKQIYVLKQPPKGPAKMESNPALLWKSLLSLEPLVLNIRNPTVCPCLLVSHRFLPINPQLH